MADHRILFLHPRPSRGRSEQWNRAPNLSASDTSNTFGCPRIGGLHGLQLILRSRQSSAGRILDEMEMQFGMRVVTDLIQHP